MLWDCREEFAYARVLKALVAFSSRIPQSPSLAVLPGADGPALEHTGADVERPDLSRRVGAPYGEPGIVLLATATNLDSEVGGVDDLDVRVASVLGSVDRLGLRGDRTTAVVDQQQEREQSYVDHGREPPITT